MRYLIRNLLFIFLLINVTACKTYKLIPEKQDTPEHNFDINLSGDTPNYADLKYWVEHPEKKNHYASLPKNYIDSTYKSEPIIDVFFVHPTLYFKGNTWNADINDKKLNREIGDAAIKNQTASSSYKPALLDCGIKINVPPFIESGEKIIIDSEYVKQNLNELVKDTDLSKFIL